MAVLLCLIDRPSVILTAPREAAGRALRAITYVHSYNVSTLTFLVEHFSFQPSQDFHGSDARAAS